MFSNVTIPELPAGCNTFTISVLLYTHSHEEFLLEIDLVPKLFSHDDSLVGNQFGQNAQRIEKRA